MDKSNGYQAHAPTYINARGNKLNGIGTPEVRRWAKALPAPATVLDLGCGTGWPVSKVLVEEGLNVYGIDASPAMVQEFRKNFPNNPVVCEAVEDSSFFDRQFDAIIAWGLMFLLPENAQETAIQKAANALHAGGKFLFTAPSQNIHWEDAITGMKSISLGAEKYRELLAVSGLLLVEEFEDVGQNHYYHAIKSLTSTSEY